jgi:hypothetical protein
MNRSNLLVYGIYAFITGLYALSLRFFYYGLSVNDVIVKQQAYNFSGIVLILAIAISFNILLFKGVFEIKKLESAKIQH